MNDWGQTNNVTVEIEEKVKGTLCGAYIIIMQPTFHIVGNMKKFWTNISEKKKLKTVIPMMKHVQ